MGYENNWTNRLYVFSHIYVSLYNIILLLLSLAMVGYGGWLIHHKCTPFTSIFITIAIVCSLLPMLFLFFQNSHEDPQKGAYVFCGRNGQHVGRIHGPNDPRLYQNGIIPRPTNQDIWGEGVFQSLPLNLRRHQIQNEDELMISTGTFSSKISIITMVLWMVGIFSLMLFSFVMTVFSFDSTLFKHSIRFDAGTTTRPNAGIYFVHHPKSIRFALFLFTSLTALAFCCNLYVYIKSAQTHLANRDAKVELPNILRNTTSQSILIL